MSNGLINQHLLRGSDCHAKPIHGACKRHSTSKSVHHFSSKYHHSPTYLYSCVARLEEVKVHRHVTRLKTF